jgi:hypothetical protein
MIGWGRVSQARDRRAVGAAQIVRRRTLGTNLCADRTHGAVELTGWAPRSPRGLIFVCAVLAVVAHVRQVALVLRYMMRGARRR